MKLVETLLFSCALFVSVITIVNFIGIFIETVLNKTHAEYKYSIIALIFTCILWGIFYFIIS
jgi:energy-converting hydrogenase Eha subunit H